MMINSSFISVMLETEYLPGNEGRRYGVIQQHKISSIM